MSGKPGSFQKGNKAGVGGPGPGPRPRLITNVIIAKLNEVNRKDPQARAYVWSLVDELFEQALPKKDKKGKLIPGTGDLSAIKEIIDRSDGKSVQGVGFEGVGDGKVTIVFESGDEKL